MRLTAHQRRLRLASEEIQVEVEKAVLAELNWLVRRLELKARRLNGYRPRVYSPRPPLRKTYMIQADLWTQFRRRMHKRLIQALVIGAITLLEIQRALFPEQSWVLFTPEEITALIEPEVGERITRVEQSIKREAGRKIVAWFNSPGTTIQALVDQLRERFGAARARNIAQNEVTNLFSRVQEEIARKIDVPTWWWSSKLDQNVCKKPLVGPDGKVYEHGCRSLHGHVFEVGQPMPPKGSHIGCRCRPILIVSGLIPNAPQRPAGVDLRIRKYDPAEPRDEEGKWTEGVTSSKFKASVINNVHEHAGAMHEILLSEIESGKRRERAIALSPEDGDINRTAIGNDYGLKIVLRAGEIFIHSHPDDENQPFSAMDYDVNVKNDLGAAGILTPHGLFWVEPGPEGWGNYSQIHRDLESSGGLYNPHFDPKKFAVEHGWNYREFVIDENHRIVQTQKILKADWDESLHPRSANGEFRDKYSSDVATTEQPQAVEFKQRPGGGWGETVAKDIHFQEFQAKVEGARQKQGQEQEAALSEISGFLHYRAWELRDKLQEDFWDGPIPEGPLTIYSVKSFGFGYNLCYATKEAAIAAAGGEIPQTMYAAEIAEEVLPFDKGQRALIADNAFMSGRRGFDPSYVPPPPVIKYTYVDNNYNRNLNQVFNQLSLPHRCNEYEENNGKQITPQEYVDRVESYLRTELQDVDVAVRCTPADFKKVLESGEYKSVIETAHSHAGAYKGQDKEYYLGRRREAEANFFGIPGDQVGGRPVYGYLCGKDNVQTESWHLEQYGNIALILKPSARSRTTFTTGDTLDDVFPGEMSYKVPNGWYLKTGRAAPCPLDDPKITCAFWAGQEDWLSKIEEYRAGLTKPEHKWVVTPKTSSGGYWEAQIMGGFKLDEIDKVVFVDKEPSDEMKALLEKQGLPWSVQKGKVEKLSKAESETQAAAEAGRLLSRNDYLELYALDDNRGYIVNTVSGRRYPEIALASALSRGDWVMVAESEAEHE